MTTIADQLAALSTALEDAIYHLKDAGKRYIASQLEIQLAAYNSAQKADGVACTNDGARCSTYVECSATGCKRAPAASSAQEPGWVMVPVEPTEEMFDEVYTNVAVSGLDNEAIADIWAAMLAAAPARLAGATQGEAVADLDGWLLNHAQRSDVDEDGGIWEIGHLNEDGVFAEVVTVNTGLYHQPEAAEPLARAILSRLAAQPQAPAATQPEPAEIDYEALIRAAWANHKYRQGTGACVAFKHGAEWFREQIAATPPVAVAAEDARGDTWKPRPGTPEARAMQREHERIDRVVAGLEAIKQEAIATPHPAPAVAELPCGCPPEGFCGASTRCQPAVAAEAGQGWTAEQIADACVEAEVPDSKFQSLMLALPTKTALATQPAQPLSEQVERQPLTAGQLSAGREAIFSTGNPFCPCDSKTFEKVARWTERHHRIGATRPHSPDTKGQ